MNRNELNAVALKKGLKNSLINVLKCYKGRGTTKKATYIVIDSKDVDRCLETFLNLGIVSATGKPHFKLKYTDGKPYDFGACYMTDEMYNELNS